MISDSELTKKEFIFQIKLATDCSDFYISSRPTLVQEIVEAENKQEVLKYVELHYPEYFDGNKVSQKLSKKSDKIVYVTIFELDNYWRSYWKSEVACCVCRKKVPIIEIKNYLGNIDLPRFACCPECESKKEEYIKLKQEQNNEEYWNSRCDYYYIYKITNKVTGKCYIGYTAREPIFRWWEHYKHSNLPIGEALQGEGIKDFTFEILEMIPKSSTDVSDMHKLETKYIKEYNSINDGYNCIVSVSDSNQDDSKSHHTNQINLFVIDDK